MRSPAKKSQVVRTVKRTRAWRSSPLGKAAVLALVVPGSESFTKVWLVSWVSTIWPMMLGVAFCQLPELSGYSICTGGWSSIPVGSVTFTFGLRMSPCCEEFTRMSKTKSSHILAGSDEVAMKSPCIAPSRGMMRSVACKTCGVQA